MNVSAAISTQEAMRAKAAETGAKIVDVPLPSDPGATRHAGVPAEAVGAMARVVAEEADRLRERHPGLPDEAIRTMLVVDRGESMEKFVRKYPAIFHTFTSRETRGELRGRMMQVIKLKMQLENGEVTPDQSGPLLADLFGVNAQQRAEVREALAREAGQAPARA